MSASRPIITRLDTPADILPLDLIREFIGHDADLDAGQDRVLPVLRMAAIDRGQKLTGIVWGAASYRIDELNTGQPGAAFCLPLAPVFAVTEIVGKDGSGADVSVPAHAYSVISSAIELGRPWAEVRPGPAWSGNVASCSVTCTAGWTADTLPESLQAWALNRIATLYDHREDLVTGTITASLPRHHTDGLLDRWLVLGNPYGA